jgi:hypothetical protein
MSEIAGCEGWKCGTWEECKRGPCVPTEDHENSTGEEEA